VSTSVTALVEKRLKKSAIGKISEQRKRVHVIILDDGSFTGIQRVKTGLFDKNKSVSFIDNIYVGLFMLPWNNE